MELEERLNVLDPQALRPIGLTQRQSEVLAWVAEGKSNNDVGLILGIRSVTVKKHLEHIFEKMRRDAHSCRGICHQSKPADYEGRFSSALLFS